MRQTTLGQRLKALTYRVQGTRRTRAGTSPPERNRLFEYINTPGKAFQPRGQPVIWVDITKNEVVGDLANGGREDLP